MRNQCRRGASIVVMKRTVFVLLLILFVSTTSAEEELQQFNGTPIGRKEYGWFVAIRRAVGNAFECSGFLIGRRYAVTAGHCIEDETTHKVQVGYLCQEFDNCGRATRIVGIRKVHRHPQGGDMVLLELSERVSKKITPIVPDLGTGAVAPLQFGKKQEMTMVGSGRTGTDEGISESVEKLVVTYLPPKKCRKKLSNQSFFTEFTICSTPPKNASPCRGDSGSALVVTASSKVVGQNLVKEFRGRDVAVALHVFGPRDCSNPKKRFGGHFRMSAAAELLESVVCQRGRKHAEDWCNTATPFVGGGGGSSLLIPPLEAVLDRTLGLSQVEVMAYNNDGSLLVTGGCTGIKVWDTAKGGAPVASLSRDGQCVQNFMELSPDGFTVAAGTDDNEILLVATDSGEILQTLKIADFEKPYAAAWDADGTQLVSVDSDGRIQLWDVAGGGIEVPLDSAPVHENVYAVYFSADDSHVTTVAANSFSDSQILEWEREGFFLLQRHVASWLKQEGWFGSLAVSPDKSQFATYSEDENDNHMVLIVDIRTYDVTRVLQGHMNTIPSVTWSPDGRYVLSGDEDDTVIIWDVTTGNVALQIDGTSIHVHDIAWSPDGLHIAVGHHDDTVTLYELSGAEE